MVNFSIEEIEEAYAKLKSYIYYDNSDLALRTKLVEFETSTTKDSLRDLLYADSIYEKKKQFGKLTVDEKLSVIQKKLNQYDEKFWEKLLNGIELKIYPKKVTNVDEKRATNFFTNISGGNPNVEKITPFIDLPIELHIISVLWILNIGTGLDSSLLDNCLGNRLILNEDKTAVVKGSGLFKPYFKQYQNWRDDAVDKANQLLKEGRNVSFVNLDIKEYFCSVRIPDSSIYSEGKAKKKGRVVETNNDTLCKLLLKIHLKYTSIFNSKMNNIKQFSKIEDGFVLLPIGLLSSYILGNEFLRDFDNDILKYARPIYYGRYVDDMIFIFVDPQSPKELGELKDSENLNEVQIFIKEYFKSILAVNRINNNEDNLEKSVSDSYDIAFVPNKYKNLSCQDSKTVIYYFDAKESHLVIEKLKDDLNERSSEFRDFPESDGDSNNDFATAAYHLQYDDSDSKIRTLKDYKENRFGLTIYFANKIFCALRKQDKVSDEECMEIIKFIKGRNSIEFFRLWEKIFTLFLICKKSNFYVKFYFQCYDAISNLKSDDKVRDNLRKTLISYLDFANEITFALDFTFYNKANDAFRSMDFKSRQMDSKVPFLFNVNGPTKVDSEWKIRYRKANMIRHHYIIHPLLNYTESSQKGKFENLIEPHFDKYFSYKLSNELIRRSPRRVKFWECNIAQIYSQLQTESELINPDFKTNIFGFNNKESKEDTGEDSENVKNNNNDNTNYNNLIKESLKLFGEINGKHLPDYEFDDAGKFAKDQFCTWTSKLENGIYINQIEADTKDRLENVKITFANVKIKNEDVLNNVRGKTNLSRERLDSLALLLNAARLEKSNLLLFPEFYIPLDLLSTIGDYSAKNSIAVVLGMEHVILKDYAYNFIVTILPFEIGGVKDAVIIPRLKNHYAPNEELMLDGNYKKVPNPENYRYDLFIWRKFYFSSYYCFELANVQHRAIWKSKVDMTIGVECNKDTKYYSNIVEATSRDLHCFFAQVNTREYGDSRLTQPSESALMDLMKIKGGNNDTIITTTINVDSLREFQRKKYPLTFSTKEYKPLPPDWNIKDVLNRIKGNSVI